MVCWLVVLFAVVSVVRADYACVCNKDVELEVLNGMSDSADSIGTLAVNDCKALVTGTVVNSGWVAVAFQHQVGYIQAVNVVPQKCTGNPPDADKVTTSGSTIVPITTTTGMMTTSSTSPPRTTTSQALTGSSMAPISTTSGSQSVVSGNTNLCPVALQSFAAADGGVLAQYDKSCYEVVPARHSWNYAEQDCRSKGGHLIDITSKAEQDFILKFLQARFNHNVWIGLHDIRQEGLYEWVTGQAVSYTHWLPGRTTTYHSIQDCVYLRPQTGGYWNDAECSDGPLYAPHAYICQYDVDTSAIQGTANPHGDGDTHLCPSSVQQHAARYFGNLAQYGSSCYELLLRYKVTWSHGERLCQQEGGHLVHIADADEQRFVQEFLTRHSPSHAVWIGLNDRVHENQFEWSSGNPVTYTNWANGHTSNFVSHHLEDCALFIPYQNGHWDDVQCGQSSIFGGDIGETHPVLCQFDTANGGQIIG